MSSLPSDPRRARGFTLLELVMVLAIIAILVGAAVPVASTLRAYRAEQATRSELQVLGAASVEFFRDLRRLPSSIGELIADPGGDRWAGPYLPAGDTDAATGCSSYEVDGWTRAYRLTASGDSLTIASAGEGAAFDDSDDLSIDLDLTWVRRHETLDTLRVVNRAIANYNAEYQTTEPLSVSWSAALAQLMARGFLPAQGDWETDAWGQAFVADPVGLAPLVRVQSPGLALQARASRAGEQGSSKQGRGR